MKSRSLSLVAPAIALVLVLVASSSAKADLGVEKVNRLVGAPGQQVLLTIGCGACTHPKRTPASFPISLVPVNHVPKPYRCGPKALCSPRVRAVPRQAPFTYLGEARLSEIDVPHAGRSYILDFAIPELAAGSYAYVIYCDSCLDGKGGTLIANPNPHPRFWRLDIRALATAPVSSTPGRRSAPELS